MNTHEHMEDTQRQMLLDILTRIESPEEMELFLDHILTTKEFKDISHRLQIFEQLSAGLPQREVSEKLGVGIATVTRGAKALRNPHFADLFGALHERGNP